ncbi:MAG: FAD-binding protein [Armatimonadetes bacterium]|nr:FAD-binding protein [Armatimonadota bacterium]
MGTNWAGNLEYGSLGVLAPDSIDRLRDLIVKSEKVKALGTRHSFNNGADTGGVQISTERLNQVLHLDPERHTVTVQGGISYGKLSAYLAEHGLALHNLASLPHISVAGACATATHGSGVKNGNLATAVRAIEFVNAHGDLVQLDEEDEDFHGAVVNLGALGVVTSMVLRVQPTFEVRQLVYQNLPLSELASDFDAVAGSAYSVSFFTTWRSDTIDQVWQKHVGFGGVAPETFHGATLSPVKLHPLPDHSAEHCTEQLGIPGSWHERLAHFRMDFTPSSGEELQSEFMVPRQHTYHALQEINKLRDRISPILHVSEIRTAASDRLWMSPAYAQDVTCIHFTWKKNWPAVQALLPEIEAALVPFRAIPHWGKLFPMRHDYLKTVVPKMGDFKALVAKHDPNGKFRNPYLDQVLG